MSDTDLCAIHCERCGAPVPLAATSPVACRHCGHTLALPSLHVDLYAKLMRGAEQLRAADQLWRALPRPMPGWMPAAVTVALIGVVATATIFWAVAGAALLRGPGCSFVLVVLLPSLVAVYAVLELLAYWVPCARLEAQWSASVDPAYPKLALCRSCGAPLSDPRDAVVVRCAYCSSDNLIRRLTRGAFRRAREIESRGRGQLDAGIATLPVLLAQRTMVRWLGAGIEIPLAGVLTASLCSACTSCEPGEVDDGAAQSVVAAEQARTRKRSAEASQRYRAAAPALRELIGPDAKPAGAELSKAAGRRIVALERNVSITWDEESRTKAERDTKLARLQALIAEPQDLLCFELLETEAWFAIDPTLVGVVVLVDRETKPGGAYAKPGGRVVGTASDTRLRFHAVLVPEAILLASWTDYAVAPQRSYLGSETGRIDCDRLRVQLERLHRGQPPEP